MAIKIDIYSNVICPWCFLGERRLEQVIKESPKPLDVEIRYLPYELNPATPAEGVDRKKYLKEKYGNSIDGAHQRLDEMGKELDIDFKFGNIELIPNTFNAHRVIWLAGKEGDQVKVMDALHEAYFTHGKDITDKNILAEIASSAGLDANKVKELLDSDQGSEEVRDLEEKAYNLGITGVPFFVFDGELAVSGAQSKETFRSVLSQLSVKAG